MRTHADTAYYMGAIDGHQRQKAHRQERAVARLIRQHRWREAHEKREALLKYIQVGHRKAPARLLLLMARAVHLI